MRPPTFLFVIVIFIYCDFRVNCSHWYYNSNIYFIGNRKNYTSHFGFDNVGIPYTLRGRSPKTRGVFRDAVSTLSTNTLSIITNFIAEWEYEPDFPYARF